MRMLDDTSNECPEQLMLRRSMPSSPNFAEHGRYKEELVAAVDPDDATPAPHAALRTRRPVQPTKRESADESAHWKGYTDSLPIFLPMADA
jgi:hypothetical protein